MNPIHSPWRLIDTGPLAGPANMAVDEALLNSFDPASSLPVLRLYGWEPPAFSLGKFQAADEVLDLPRCRAAGIPVVRRVTGGGVIYHASELTYSIVCAQRHIPDATSVKGAFRTLCGFLLLTYKRLGLDAAFAVDRHPGHGRLGERTPFCFAGKEEYDILVGGRKLGGNAQRRIRETVFQHGSIPLENRLATALPFLRERPAGVEEGTVSLAELGVTLPIDRLKGVLAEAFRENLGVELQEEGLTTAEAALAEKLQREKYETKGWNQEGREA
ncbi:lipoate--protein ligase family protein [Geobacter sp. AOG1]|uniref:lipoate--protein ligase family protein n=1 Tax=Geobacter sp. AOG1 TaxID=1566346 RepID=UPI001CC54E3F|nr:lipoate--protein ligase family protein [Geobacter sp. AOG1]GFE56477.1 lipoate-protein ligase [Geobacter sp. AOG1]